MVKFSLLLATGTLALAQQYTISTVAGGAPPATPVAATGISIGQPARVATDTAGNVYFSASNAVFKVSSGGTLTLVAGTSRAGYSGDGGLAIKAQLNGPQGIAVDPSGNIYIADSGNNRVRIITTDGVINTFAGTGLTSNGGPRTYNDGNPANTALLKLPKGVALDKNGNVYIADTGDNSIRIVTTDGIINTFAGDSYPSFAGDTAAAVDAELHSPSDVTVDSSGNVYIADTGNASIRKVTTDGLINTVAGSQAIGSTGDGAGATKATLLTPISLVVDSSGNIYILENGDGKIRKVDVTSGNISTIAGTGAAGFGGDGGAATSAVMNYPTGLAIDGSSNFYIADALNQRIRKIAGTTISTIAGNGVSSFSGNGGAALNAQMNSPQGVAVDAAGNLYIADTGNNVVRKVGTDGNIVAFAGNGQAGNGGDGGAAASAQLKAPQGVSVDAKGIVYIADSGNARVRKVDLTGNISNVAGNGTPGYGGDNGSAGTSQLYTPTAVAADAAGNLYIADFNNNRIRKVSTNGTITTVAGNGYAGYSGDGGPATSAQLSLPQGVAVDAAGNLYIADTGNNVIRLVNTTGLISTLAGNGLAGFSGDGGLAIQAQIGNPSSVSVDALGNVYVSDGSTRIRKIFPNGLIATIAGNGTVGYSGDGGLATSASLNSPAAVALDASGNAYIADSANNAIRMLVSSGYGLKVAAVTNGATNQTGSLAPGEVVVLYGSGLGPSSLTTFQLNSAGQVPVITGGTSVYFNNIPGPVLYTSANQVGAIVPFGVSGSTVQVVTQYNGSVSAPASVALAKVAPALFTLNASGSGQAAAINQNNAVNGTASPANAGSYVSLYATGLGQTNPGGQDGVPTGTTLPLPLQTVTAAIGGKPATIQYAGGAPGLVAGVMQINVQVPSGLAAGAAEVILTVGNVTSPHGVTIAVSGN
jgi:trimeric autotransporter adhesin